MDRYKFDEVEHIHTLDGKPLMGTTTVLKTISKPALIPWAAKMTVEYIEKNCSFLDGDPTGFYSVTKEDLKFAKRAHTQKKDDAADWGTTVHKAIEIWINTKHIPDEVVIKGMKVKVLPEHRVAIEQFVSWAVSNNAEFILSERGIFSEKWWVGGIVDFVCKINGKIVVGDIKTSSGIWEEYWLQVAAYTQMLVDNKILDTIDGVTMTIVNCKKDGSVVVESRTDIEDNIKAFESAVVLHKRFNK